MRQPSSSRLCNPHFSRRSGNTDARFPHVPGWFKPPVLNAKWALETCMRPSRKRIIHNPLVLRFCKLLKFKEVIENLLFQRLDIRLHLRFCGGVSPCLGQL